MDRDEIYKEVCELVEMDRASIGAKDMTFLPYGSCILYAARAVQAIRKRGRRAVLNAGSCNWPMIREDQDDGKRMTHFSYEWSPQDELSLRANQLGLLPEMHAWAAIIETQELVDMSTGGLVAQAALFGFDWPGDPPPKYLWCAAAEYPKRVVYRPDMGAIKRALVAVLQCYGKDFLKDVMS